MNSLAAWLVSPIESVSAVVEENTAATEELAASATEVSRLIEAIANVSQENTASIEEVSADTDDMTSRIGGTHAMVVDLSSMAAKMQRLLANFRIA